MEVIKCNTEVAMETTGEARNSKTKSKMAESRFAWSDEIVVDELKLNALRSYFSEGNSVSFPERYSKAEKGWDFDILCMRSPGVRRDLCKCASLRTLIRSVVSIRTLKCISL